MVPKKRDSFLIERLDKVGVSLLRGLLAERGFFAAVYAAVRLIPHGRVMTYAGIAARLGVPRGARAVGWALRALAPSRVRALPWHRVVGFGGRISPRDGLGQHLACAESSSKRCSV